MESNGCSPYHVGDIAAHYPWRRSELFQRLSRQALSQESSQGSRRPDAETHLETQTSVNLAWFAVFYTLEGGRTTPLVVEFMAVF